MRPIVFCEKKIFRSTEEADEFLAKLSPLPGNERVRKGIAHRRYQCPRCGWWHLTSMRSKERRLIETRRKARQ